MHLVMAETLTAQTTRHEADMAIRPIVLEARNLSKRFGNRYVLRDLSLEVRHGEFVCVLGGSGCGKSTLLNCLAGLEPFEGALSVTDDKGALALPAVVFQEYTLFPWLTVEENVMFGLRHRSSYPKNRWRDLAHQALVQVGLRECFDQYPSTLSGGMKQRVAIARCLVFRPEIILMDEPFAALDALTRDVLQTELLRIWQESHTTIIFVTHSISEAVKLADRVLLLGEGGAREEITIDARRPRDQGDPHVGDYESRIRHWIFSRQGMSKDS